MKPAFSEVLRLYDFCLSPELIAQKPASPRDSARLLVFDRASKHREDAVFRDIGEFLPEQSVLVLNETRVIPAKLTLTRTTGGMVSALVLGRQGSSLRVFANRKLRIGELLTLAASHTFTVQAQNGKEWLITPSFAEDPDRVLDKLGTMPLPPYIKHSPLSPQGLRREYQSVFARERGSIAAPTASLHFTQSLLSRLQQRGIRLAFVTLHVHLGTFAPLTEEQWREGALHRETYHMSDETAEILGSAKRSGDPIIAVGTTVVRTLESCCDEKGKIVRRAGETNLFIREEYTFRLVDGLITNFHVPRSSLLMLVSAFAGRENILSLYQHALDERYRFFSFGDAMLIL
jgi:S-adenosylmethionine:tRNA ribosyltransferase-isomerase